VLHRLYSLVFFSLDPKFYQSYHTFKVKILKLNTSLILYLFVVYFHQDMDFDSKCFCFRVFRPISALAEHNRIDKIFPHLTYAV
jgi:hypothetical protein